MITGDGAFHLALAGVHGNSDSLGKTNTACTRRHTRGGQFNGQEKLHELVLAGTFHFTERFNHRQDFLVDWAVLPICSRHPFYTHTHTRTPARAVTLPPPLDPGWCGTAGSLVLYTGPLHLQPAWRHKHSEAPNIPSTSTSTLPAIYTSWPALG